MSLNMGERESTVDWSAVIKKTLNLIVRMEEDRQNTLQKLGMFIAKCIHDVFIFA